MCSMRSLMRNPFFQLNSTNIGEGPQIVLRLHHEGLLPHQLSSIHVIFSIRTMPLYPTSIVISLHQANRHWDEVTHMDSARLVGALGKALHWTRTHTPMVSHSLLLAHWVVPRQPVQRVYGLPSLSKPTEWCGPLAKG